jgi:hypothetical protein
MTETLIAFLYSDGCIEVNPFFRRRIGDAVTIDDLVNQGWEFKSVSTNWFKAESRDACWFGLVMTRDK